MQTTTDIGGRTRAADFTLEQLVGTLSTDPDAYASFRERYVNASDEERARLLLAFGTSESDLAVMTAPNEANQIVWTTTITVTTTTVTEA